MLARKSAAIADKIVIGRRFMSAQPALQGPRTTRLQIMSMSSRRRHALKLAHHVSVNLECASAARPADDDSTPSMQASAPSLPHQGVGSG